VVATDAPVDARTLQRIAARAVFALARTGSTYSNDSGDSAIAFSTHALQRATGAAASAPVRHTMTSAREEEDHRWPFHRAPDPS
jgi:D-aminopeptidase